MFEPIPAQIGVPGTPILIVAMLPPRDIIYVDSQGRLLWSSGDYITTDWRYNAETKEWYDINGPTEDEEVASE